MDKINFWMNVNEIMLKGGFLIFLATSSYEDLKERNIRVCLFLAFGAAGTALRGVQLILESRAYILCFGTDGLWEFAGKRLKDICMAMMIGGGLLALAAATGEAVGQGDGWFFVVSGVYLDFVRNIALFCGGMVLCFLACGALFVKGVLAGRDVRHVRLPFLPFLVPAGIGVMFL